MKFNALTITALILIVAACGSKEQVKARIFERKVMGKNTLLVKYEYTANGKTYADSVVLKDAIINSDSINVTLNTSNPGKASPEPGKYPVQNN